MRDNINKHKRNISTATNDTFKLNEMIHLSWGYRTFNTDSALIYSNKSIKLAKKLNFDSLQSKALSIKGTIHKIRNEFDSAFYYQLESLKLRPINDVYGRVFNYSELGEYYSIQGKYLLSEYYYTKGLETLDSMLAATHLISNENAVDKFKGIIEESNGVNKLSDTKESDLDKIIDFNKRSNELNKFLAQLSDLNMKIGFTNLNSNNPNAAVSSFRKVLNLYQFDSTKIYRFDYIIESFLGMGAAFNNLGKIDSSMKYLELAVSNATKRLDSLIMGKSYREFSKLKLLQASNSKAKNYATISTEIFNKIGAKRDWLLSKLLEMEIQVKLNQDIENIYYELESLKEIKKDSVLLIKFSKLRYEVFSLLGEKDSAFSELQHLNKLEKSWYESIIQSRFSELQELNNVKDLRLNLNYKQSQIETLISRNSLFIILIVLLCILILTIAIFFFKQRKSRELLAQLNNQLKSSNYSLTEVMERKQELLSILAHDIRSPVLLSHKTLELLQSGKVNEQNQATYIAQVNEAIGRVAMLVQNILVWISSNDGEIIGSFKQYNVKDLIEETLMDYDERINEKNIEIELFLDDLYIEMDVVTSKIILNNILSNAIKFSDFNKKLTLTLDSDGLKVTNDGIPLDNNQLNEINSHKKTYSKLGTSGEKGTGLGLTIINNLSAYNKFNFSIESTGSKTTAKLIF